jgi:catechol 2,3-dioxygenase-like lactoylglutathione lyase family enzyme
MTQGVAVVGIYVRDQDEALAFYVDRLGFRLHTDARNGDYRWLTVQCPAQPSFQLGLFVPQPPTVDAATAQTLRAAVAASTAGGCGTNSPSWNDGCAGHCTVSQR